MKKEMVILAKSTKHYPNHCIAGIDLKTDKWIRPVSSNINTEGAVPPEQIKYSNGEELKVLDLVEIEFLSHTPSNAQTENYLYDENIHWKKSGEISFEELIRKVRTDTPTFIFKNTANVLTDSEINGCSLLFVKIYNVCINVQTFERKKVTVSFDYNGERYQYIRVEDPDVVKQYIRCENGLYRLNNEMYAVFSLTDRYYRTGKYYKMLAKLFF